MLLALASLALAGCIGVYDAAPPPNFRIENKSADAVVVMIDGMVDSRHEVAGHGAANLEWAADCIPAVTTVETAGGDRIGRLEEDLCPEWTLTITEDGTLEYGRAK